MVQWFSLEKLLGNLSLNEEESLKTLSTHGVLIFPDSSAPAFLQVPDLSLLDFLSFVLVDAFMLSNWFAVSSKCILKVAIRRLTRRDIDSGNVDNFPFNCSTIESN